MWLAVASGWGPVAVPSPQPKPSGGQPDSKDDQPDLAIRAIRVNGQVPDGTNDCKAGTNDLAVVVKNIGKGDAVSCSVRLTVDGDDVDASVAGLSAGQEQEVRFDDVRLKKGEHKLVALVDPEHAVHDSKDANDQGKVSARCTEAA